MGDIGGYEWGFTCPECGEFHGLSGVGYGEHPLVNGERSVRTRAVESGDTLGCPDCGHTFRVVFESVSADAQEV